MLLYLIKRNLAQYPISQQLRLIINRYIPRRRGNRSALQKQNIPNKNQQKLQKKESKDLVIAKDGLQQSSAAATGIKGPQPETPVSKCLYAVWDFEVCPITFDFINFLILADIQRERLQFDSIQFLLLPGPHNGHRDQAVHSLNEKNYRIGSIVLPAISLLKCQAKALSFCSREDAAQFISTKSKNSIFPNGYTVEQPVNFYGWRNCRQAFEEGYSLQRLKAEPRSTEIIADWYERNCQGKRLLTFSLRESFYEAERNSDVEAVKRFISELDKEKYVAVVLRDLDRISEGFSEWQSVGATDGQFAVWDIRIRQALYEKADMNFFVNNGPFVLALFSKTINYAVFKMLTSSVFVTSDKYFEMHGWKVGDNFWGACKNQNIFWEDESIDGFRKVLREFV